LDRDKKYDPSRGSKNTILFGRLATDHDQQGISAPKSIICILVTIFISLSI
jgi:hypothetical protein